MISFFARNDIATNILMVAILIFAGWLAFDKIPYEVYPNQHFNEVRINVPYRGSSPTDVERNVSIPIEQALDGLPGIKEIYSCLLYTSPSPRDQRGSRMPSSA